MIEHRSLYNSVELKKFKDLEDPDSILHKEYKNIISMAAANMLFVNDLICGIIVDLGCDLKNDGLFEKEVKFYFNALNRERVKYERLINRCTGEDLSWIYADQQELFYEEVKHDLNIAYYTIKSECDRLGIIKSRTLSRLHQLRLISCASLEICNVWEERMHRFLPERLAYYSIRHLRLDSIYGYIKKIHSKLFHPYLKKFGDEEVTDMSMMADEILLKKLIDPKLIYKAATYTGGSENVI